MVWYPPQCLDVPACVLFVHWNLPKGVGPMVWYPPHRLCGIRYIRALDLWFGILLNALSFLHVFFLCIGIYPRTLDLWFGILLIVSAEFGTSGRWTYGLVSSSMP